MKANIKQPQIPILLNKPSKAELWVSAFVFINVISFYLLFNQDLEHRATVSVPYGVFAVVFAVAMGYLSFKRLFRCTASALQEKKIVFEHLFLLALLLIYTSFFLKAYTSFSTLIEQPLLESPLLVMPIFVFVCFILFQTFSYLGSRGQLSLGHLITHVRKLSFKEDSFEPYEWMKPSQVNIGDKFVVTKGELVPLDGVVSKGSALVEQRRISFSPVPRIIGKGDKTYAGSFVRAGEIECVSRELFDDSSVTESLEALASATSEGSHVLEEAEKKIWIISFFLLVVACGAGFGWSSYTGSFETTASVVSSLLFLVIFSSYTILPFLFRRLLAVRAFKLGGLINNPQVTLSKLSKIRTLIFDFLFASPFGEPSVDEFEIIDQRVESRALASAIASVASKSDGEVHEAIVTYLSRSFHKLRVHNVKDPILTDVGALSGMVEGVKITLGTQDALVASGVEFSLSEESASSTRDETLYAAVNNQSVARFKIAPPFTQDAKTLTAKLRKQAIRPVLCSLDSSSLVDARGRAAGFSLSDIHAGLSKPELIELGEKICDSAIVLNSNSPLELWEAQKVSISFFDEMKWEFKDSNIKLLDYKLDSLEEIIGLARRGERVLNFICMSALIVGLLAGLLTMFRFLSPGLTLVFSGIWATFLLLLVKHYLRERQSKERSF